MSKYCNLSTLVLFVSKYDSSPAQIVRTHLHSYLITRQNPYVVHPHFSGDGRQNFVTVFKLHPEHGVG